jgi:hypothetical protein
MDLRQLEKWLFRLPMSPVLLVPGHGEVQTKAAIQKRLVDAQAKRAKNKDLVAQGKSLDEIGAAVGDRPVAPGPARKAEVSPVREDPHAGFYSLSQYWIRTAPSPCIRLQIPSKAEISRAEVADTIRTR